MVLPLRSYTDDEIYRGPHPLTDPVHFENHVRDVHHEVIGKYFEENLSFAINLGLTVADLTIVEAIGKAHRKVKLSTLPVQERRLGALMRLIDELDIGPHRAPADVFDAFFAEMESISRWHWYKHIITAPWQHGANVSYQSLNGKKEIFFSVTVYPARMESVGYWLPQVARPIEKALKDEECGAIIYGEYGVTISVRRDGASSRMSPLGKQRQAVEDQVLTGRRPVVLIIDDESKKIDDLFHFVQEDFHIHRVPRVTSGIQYMEAADVAIAVVDMQMPDDGLWGSEETENYRMTGAKVVELIRERWPKTKLCILSGTRHKIADEVLQLVDLVLRKPIDSLALKDQLKSLPAS